MKLCPLCAEEVQEAAIKCKHCGGSLITETTPKQPSAAAPVDILLIVFGLVGWALALYMYATDSPTLASIVGSLAAVALPIGLIKNHLSHAKRRDQ
jgi:hypothetical protein